MVMSVVLFQENTYLLAFCIRLCAEVFNAIPHYRDKVYDSDPDGSYSKAKLERLKCSSETEQNILGQTSPNSLCFDSFPTSESTLFSEVAVLCAYGYFQTS